jgi:uncharacterized membrane protein SpoIIM required for sporulation
MVCAATAGVLLVGAVAVTGAGYLGLLLQTLIAGSPTDLASQSIQQLRATYSSGGHLHSPPVAWWSIWWAALALAVTWTAVTWFAQRTVGLTTPRPPAIAVTFAPEPRRDPAGHLDGFPETDLLSEP